MKIISPKSITSETIERLLNKMMDVSLDKWDEGWYICVKHGYNKHFLGLPDGMFLDEWIRQLPHPQLLRLYKDLIKIQ